MIVTIFRSRLRDEAREEYERLAPRIEELARSVPGFRAIKTFEAADGERVSIVEFETQEAHDAWRDHPEHLEAQRRGRDEFYSEYRIDVCAPVRTREFRREGDVPAPERRSTGPVSGACLCGEVRFEVELPSLFCLHCHCSMCRRNHGAGFVTWAVVATESLRILAGKERLVRYQSSRHGSRTFCGRCGSSLFCESALHPERVDIPLANLEGPIDREPGMHVFFDDRAAWVRVADGLPRLGGPSGTEPIG